MLLLMFAVPLDIGRRESARNLFRNRCFSAVKDLSVKKIMMTVIYSEMSRDSLSNIKMFSDEEECEPSLAVLTPL
jgi:hypothetical protein